MFFYRKSNQIDFFLSININWPDRDRKPDKSQQFCIFHIVWENVIKYGHMVWWSGIIMNDWKLKLWLTFKTSSGMLTGESMTSGKQMVADD